MRYQSLYKASELAAAGLKAGDSITALALKIHSVPLLSLLDFRLSVAFVTDTHTVDRCVHLLCCDGIRVHVLPHLSKAFRRTNLPNNKHSDR